MKSIYNIEAYSLPPAEECGFWADVWNTYTLTLNGDSYERKQDVYLVDFPYESGKEFRNGLGLVQEKGIINKIVPVLRKVKL